MNYENESMTLPTELLKKHVRTVFVETGTADGRAVQQALDCGFKIIYSIEIDSRYYEMADQRFFNELGVNLFLGDTLDLLPRIMPNIILPATFWLDAHMQPDTGYVTGKVDVPVMQELEIIGSHNIKTHTLMIDDMRLAGEDTYWKDIKVLDIIAAIQKINRDYVITFEDSKAAKQDILVAFVPGTSLIEV